jgi:type IV secretory pathway VirB2 component (pilin)
MLQTTNSHSPFSTACTAVTQLTVMTMLAIATYMAMTSGVFAADALGNALCKVAQLAMGKAGRGIATLAVIILGIGATLGKVSWGMAMIVTVGIAVIFNAETLATHVGAGGTACGPAPAATTPTTPPTTPP